MASAELPSTPPSNPIEITEQGLQSTPLSRGSGSDISYDSRHHQSHYKPYLADDVRNAKRLSLDDFLREVCGCDKDWVNQRRNGWQTIARSSSIRDKLDAFRETRGGETRRYAPFVVLANLILDGLGHKDIRFCRNDNTFISGSYASRKPDVVVVRVASLGKRTIESCDKSGPSPPFWWRDVLSFNEFERTNAEGKTTEIGEGFGDTLSLPSSSTNARKRSSDTAHSSPPSKRAKIVTKKDTQCASYALEMLAHGGFRDFVLGMYTKNEDIQLLYYDHSAVIFSHPVNIAENIEHLIHIVDAMIFTRWGLSSLIDVAHNDIPDSTPIRHPYLNLFSGVSLSLLDGAFRVTLQQILFYQHGIIGRGSSVIKGKVSVAPVPKKGSVCVVKLTRPAKTRLSESTLIDDARQLARSRTEWEWILNHLPMILYSTSLPLTPTQIRLAALFEDYEQRVLRIAVMSELTPIAELTDPAKLKIVFRDIFRCYRWLVEEAKILHRDVSVANIMFRCGNDGRVHGVLNDFDHAIHTDVPRSPSSLQRTGTAPYMAIDILRTSPPPVHLYRHDLESLYYVLVCTVCPADHPSIRDWFSLGGRQMAGAKRDFFDQAPLAPRAGFEIFSKWVTGIHRAFVRGLQEQTNDVMGWEGDKPYDAMTLGGKVSFEIFSVIFEDLG